MPAAPATRAVFGGALCGEGGDFGTGIGAALGWQDMEIRRKESGEPFVVLHGKGEELFAARGAKKIHISLTHTENYAAATAILES